MKSSIELTSKIDCFINSLLYTPVRIFEFVFESVDAYGFFSLSVWMCACVCVSERGLQVWASAREPAYFISPYMYLDTRVSARFGCPGDQQACLVDKFTNGTGSILKGDPRLWPHLISNKT